MYTDRLILFIDLLGFKSIVNLSLQAPEYLKTIYELLSGITSNPISVETFGSINRQLVPKDRVEEVTELNKLFSASKKSNSTLAVTHFSDSLVLSADATDHTATFSILELVAKLSFRLWEEHKVLTRGGVAIGKLIHEEGGVLIGPAMVRAYELESAFAEFPRVIIDENCVDYIKGNHLYKAMEKLFKSVSALESEDKKSILSTGLEINLATAFNYLLHSHHGASPAPRKRYENALEQAEQKLQTTYSKLEKDDVKRKYMYLIEELREMKRDFTFWKDIKF